MMEKYPWLEPDNERRNISNREILDKYVDMLYKYKDASSSRDEIGTCLNIELEIDVTAKSPFFISPYHAKGYSWLVSNYATCDYSRDQSKCSTMPSTTIVA